MNHEKESVWDYPRPPRVEPAKRRVRVYFDGRQIVDSDRALRVLETSHPPTYYIPRDAIDQTVLVPHERRTVCEFKGGARYFSLQGTGRVAEAAAWEYPQPRPGYEELRDHLAFYAGEMVTCYVGEERIDPQAGTFYGGWITSDIVGPFKGGAGTRGW